MNWIHHQELHPYVSIQLSRLFNLPPARRLKSLQVCRKWTASVLLMMTVIKVSRRFLCFCSWTLDVDGLLPANQVKRLRPVAVWRITKTRGTLGSSRSRGSWGSRHTGLSSGTILTILANARLASWSCYNEIRFDKEGFWKCSYKNATTTYSSV